MELKSAEIGLVSATATTAPEPLDQLPFSGGAALFLQQIDLVLRISAFVFALPAAIQHLPTAQRPLAFDALMLSSHDPRMAHGGAAGEGKYLRN
jgi:hypothetical protein